jgi:osmotically-inducible protein OsmY
MAARAETNGIAKNGVEGLAPENVGEQVQRRLQESSYYFLRRITCVCDRGIVTLRGRVPTYYLKQTVQALAEKVEGVEQVINLVEVIEPGEGA